MPSFTSPRSASASASPFRTRGRGARAPPVPTTSGRARWYSAIALLSNRCSSESESARASSASAIASLVDRGDAGGEEARIDTQPVSEPLDRLGASDASRRARSLRDVFLREAGRRRGRSALKRRRPDAQGAQPVTERSPGVASCRRTARRTGLLATRDALPRTFPNSLLPLHLPATAANRMPDT